MNRIYPILTFFFFAIIPIFVYNNCGQHRDYSPEVIPVTKLHEIAAEELALNPIADLCSDTLNFSCSHYVFSPDVENSGSHNSYPCVQVSDSLQICTTGMELTFNTSEAIQNCSDCTDEEIKMRYIYDEYTCFNKALELKGTSPIQFDGESLGEALRGAHKLCLELNGEAQ